jgi:hypothetical protein
MRFRLDLTIDLEQSCVTTPKALIEKAQCVHGPAISEHRKKRWTARIFALDLAPVSGRKRDVIVAKEEGTPQRR